MKTRIRNRSAVYRLIVDPERVIASDNVQGWILGLLVSAGGRLTREEMVTQFTKVLRKKRPDLAVRPTSVLSKHQRVLRDLKLLQIVDGSGKPVPTRKRKTLVRPK